MIFLPICTNNISGAVTVIVFAVALALSLAVIPTVFGLLSSGTEIARDHLHHLMNLHRVSKKTVPVLFCE